ncbi:hypothetical protein C7S16_4675 [Burkholderia thailandensis]|uniref:Uncharacterized protein n=1 Tax=Burkholderia thailandensis TaxID=57975 RepID=A0AAW9CMK6_BURTH|nr:hypothetical protein [Burkholderia thailandensis]MDW9252098.1 hypothetical protein [Burkholderia thailandensis]
MNRASHSASKKRFPFPSPIDVDQLSARIDRRQSSGERREAACPANLKRSGAFTA